eukprot:TRINITY_DN3178_c0_g3_i6.p1 TRINITY_DN3178_c0_g3~~TRINITY_DN3178_c0_g3_i6.p1  ORF type:complete len:1090 (-),score=393.49 TRINITY_DN3178_c0_g3_i6:117-3386(-)
MPSLVGSEMCIRDSFKCFPTCNAGDQKKPLENTLRVWSDAKNWPNGVVPKAGDNVKVPDEWRLVIDADTPLLNSLEVNGELTIDESRPLTKINAKNIWIRKGIFKVGSKEKPFTNKLEINLHGVKEDPQLTLDSTLEGGNKILAITGQVLLYGAPNDNIWTRLAQPVKAGDSKVVVVNVDGWKVGDEIVIAPTSIDPNQEEKRVIKAIDAGSKTVTLDAPLKFFHFGAAEPISIEKPQGAKLDMRAEVGLLTRNIQIRSVFESSQPTYGCKIQIAEYPEGEWVRRGQIVFDGVEIQNCGQPDTNNAAVNFEQISKEGEASIVSRSAIHGSNAYHLNILGAQNIVVNNNVFYRSFKNGVRILASNLVTFTNNLVIGNKVRTSVVFTENVLDQTTAFHVVPQESVQNQLKISNNVVAASEFFAYMLPGDDCKRTENDKWFFLNTAHSSEYGFVILKGKTEECVVVSDLTAYKTYSGINSFDKIKQIRAQRLVVSDNRAGISLQLAFPHDGGRLQVEDSYVAGTSLPDYGSQPQECKKIYGIRLPVFTNVGRQFPLTGSQLPFHKIKGDATWGNGRLHVQNVIFANFNNKGGCNANAALKTNELASDKSQPVSLEKITKINVGPNALVVIDKPDPSWVGLDDCGSMQCTGLYNVLIRDLDGSFTGSKSTIISYNEGIAKKGKCEAQPENNLYICDTHDYGLLQWDNIDEDAVTRLISPVSIKSAKIGYANTLNTFMDHEWHGFYTSKKRRGRFPAVVPAGEIYEVRATGTTPMKTRWQLQGGLERSQYVIVKFYLTRQDFPQISLRGAVIRPTVIDSANPNNDFDLSTKSESCGSNKYFFKERVLEFVLNGDSHCDIIVEQIPSVQVSLKLAVSVDDFFKNTDQAQYVDKLAALLEIPTDKLKIVQIRRDSNTIDLSIDSTVANNEKVTSQTTKQATSAIQQKVNTIAGMTATNMIPGVESVSTDGHVLAVNNELKPAGAAATASNSASADTTVVEIKTAPAGPSTEKPAESSKLPLFLGIGAAIVVLIGIVAFFVLKKNAAKKEEKQIEVTAAKVQPQISTSYPESYFINIQSAYSYLTTIHILSCIRNLV